MTTAAHNRQQAAAVLTPFGDGVAAASQPAASRLRMRWNCHIRMALTTTKKSFTSNMPSLRYCSGFVSQSVEPERNWTTKETQMYGTRFLSATNGILENKPNMRNVMTVMNPRIVAVPN